LSPVCYFAADKNWIVFLFGNFSFSQGKQKILPSTWHVYWFEKINVLLLVYLQFCYSYSGRRLMGSRIMGSIR
jgi:hypothetical protein